MQRPLGFDTLRAAAAARHDRSSTPANVWIGPRFHDEPAKVRCHPPAHERLGLRMLTGTFSAASVANGAVARLFRREA